MQQQQLRILKQLGEAKSRTKNMWSDAARRRLTRMRRVAREADPPPWRLPLPARDAEYARSGDGPASFGRAAQ